MFKTFFYIPAYNQRFFSALTKYKPDYFVFDLEDSVSSVKIDDAVQNILQVPSSNIDNIFVRIRNTEISQIDYNVFNIYKNIIIPKIESEKQLDLFFSKLSQSFSINLFKFILLFESPMSIINLPKILEIFNERIYGIGFGSHDYCSLANVLHELPYIETPRSLVLLYGKAYNKVCLDIASLVISNYKSFVNECKNGFYMGFDAKPILHPWQFETISSICFYSDEEIKNAKCAFNIYNSLIPSNINAIKVNNKIIEKPNISRINEVINYLLKNKLL